MSTVKEDGEQKFTKGAYFLGKMVWAKEYRKLIDLLSKQKNNLNGFKLGVYSNGENVHEMAVRMFKPKTLSDAYCLTTLQETTLEAIKKKSRPFLNQTNRRFGVTNVSRSNEKEEEFVDADDTLVDTVHEKVMPQISLNALSGVSSFQTMSVIGLVAKGHKLHILVTSGSTKRLGLYSWEYLSFAVSVAGGSVGEDVIWLLVGVRGTNKVVTVVRILESNEKKLGPLFLTNYHLQGLDLRIPLIPGTQPVNIRPYRHPPVQKDAIEAMIKELLKSGLNKHTIKDKFLIPVIEELIDELGGGVIFSKLDLRSGYHQIRMYKDNIAKTSFKTHEGHYEFLVMPFGLTNAPLTFQALMNEIYNRSLEDHVQHLIVVLSKMKDHSLYAKESKCVFGTTHVKYLEHVISTEGVATDPSKGVGLGAVLQQDGHPIAYLSKSLAPKHHSIPTYEKEFLAVLLALKKWRRYLLKYLLDQRITTSDQIKWLPKLMGYDYEVVYKHGKDNVVADALSRREDVGELLSTTTHYALHNNQLLRKGKMVVGNDESLRKDFLSYFHDGTIEGHSRVRATTHKICCVFYWKGLRKQLKHYVKECLVCQRCKPYLSAYPGLLQSLPIPKTVWSSISMDFIEGLPKSYGYTVIFVVVDILTKYGYFIPVLHPFTALQVAQVFLDQALYGQPPTTHVPYVEGFSKVDVVDRSLITREQAIDMMNYKVFINPSLSDVLCTVTAKALAMGKFAEAATQRFMEYSDLDKILNVSYNGDNSKSKKYMAAVPGTRDYSKQHYKDIYLLPLQTLGESGGDSSWEGGDDFGVDVLCFHTCLTDILGFLEKLEWSFEQDIDDEEEEDEGGEGGSEV
ncbi:gypsy/ty3 retroelement polyprotein [Tanacetum coccineum]